MTKDAKQRQANKEQLPTPVEFYFDVPLYKSFGPSTPVDPLDLSFQGYLDSVRFYNKTIDAYCIYCNDSSIFYRRKEANEIDLIGRSEYTDFQVILYCGRNAAHIYEFKFKVITKTLMKIGQYPSVADISLPQLVKYRRILGSELYIEFTKAVGLVTHGVGIGSFIYLRRIIEALIGLAHESAKVSLGWNDDQYQKSRVIEKIKMLKGYLPDLMVKNAAVYSILSKGVHDLTEDECLRYFKPLQAAIELILNEHLQRLEHEQNVKAAEQAIAGILSELAEPSK